MPVPSGQSDHDRLMSWRMHRCYSPAYMRRWMIWALLAVLWGLQGAFAAYRHAPRQAFLMLGIAVFFGYIGRIVHTREPGR